MRSIRTFLAIIALLWVGTACSPPNVPAPEKPPEPQSVAAPAASDGK